MFGYSKLDVMFGRETPDAVRLYYRDIVKPSVEFRQETIQSIDPVAKRGHDRSRHLRRRRAGGRARRRHRARADARARRGRQRVLYGRRRGARARRPPDVRFAATRSSACSAPFYKCPAAPYEARDDAARHRSCERGVRDATTIKVITPMGDADPDLAGGVGGDPRGPRRARHRVLARDRRRRASIPRRKPATLRDGRTVQLRPLPRRSGAPRAGGRRGVGDDRSTAGSRSTTPRSRRSSPTSTRSATSRARRCRAVGVIAEGEAGTVADVLIHRLRGGDEPPPYPGIATCYIEFGGAEVAKFDVNFLGGPTPSASSPSRRRARGARRRSSAPPAANAGSVAP